MNLIIKSLIAHNVNTSVLSIQWWFYFTFIHLADAFIQSVIHWIQGTQIISTFFPENRTHYRQFELWGGYTKIISGVRFYFIKTTTLHSNWWMRTVNTVSALSFHSSCLNILYILGLNTHYSTSFQMTDINHVHCIQKHPPSVRPLPTIQPQA